MILITGATGHIGNVLVKKLYETGEKIRIFVLPDEDISIFNNMDMDIVYGDIRNKDDVLKATEGVNKIFHLAAIISILPWKNEKVYSVNIGGVENILNAMKFHNIKDLIYVSSVHAFAEIERGATIDEETPISPKLTTGAYGKSKAIATQKVIEAGEKGEINYKILFPSGVIGPYDYKLSEIGKVIKDFLDGKIRYCVDGVFDFVDVRDVVDGIIAASKLNKKNEKFILSGENISMRRFFKYLNSITEKNEKIKFISPVNSYIISYGSVLHHLFSNKNLIFSPYTVHTLTGYYKFSSEKAKKILHYNPRSIYTSLKDTINWINNYYILKNKVAL
ncbi:hypothetical protein XO10_03200 [Marinitoga sp. 1135]|uniref:Nucleoside-diphosphate-sugar epimerase n=1 Tax=Marinitoga piezophila (strain DSM 14283 / JCM 11233 / KA3) TaxID=443254 RepID=H2J608_MARPK|nr:MULTISPECIES: NAD-dependent epimerase/dehydratase family protein [Marinitoga]AEX85069.1 nucleoside-diphosphate-sugar epimerase [Marinitoga piezophila KA3]APT75576.1 hypothetical protein LN42_03600 [Marinitoga sp. 1137]NUU95284.1 hypothetical protein [Marinitoga sp. 1135]NUU97218.1 hypothetical protein [Marinitoga sp. 1138]